MRLIFATFFAIITPLVIAISYVNCKYSKTISQVSINNLRKCLNFLVADVECGVPEIGDRLGFKIISGQDAAKGEFPWYFIFKIYFLKLEMKSFLELLF